MHGPLSHRPVDCGHRLRVPSGSGWNSLTRRLRLQDSSWLVLLCRSLPGMVTIYLFPFLVRSVSINAEVCKDCSGKPKAMERECTILCTLRDCARRLLESCVNQRHHLFLLPALPEVSTPLSMSPEASPFAR